MEYKLPKKRESATYELVILSQELGRFKIYLTVGVNETGRPLEIWLDCAKEGALLRELMHGWASLFSVALQGGVPLRRMAHLYKPWRFEPLGKVEGFDRIQTCESVLSLVVAVLEAEFPKEFTDEVVGQKDLFSK